RWHIVDSARFVPPARVPRPSRPVAHPGCGTLRARRAESEDARYPPRIRGGRWIHTGGAPARRTTSGGDRGGEVLAFERTCRGTRCIRDTAWAVGHLGGTGTVTRASWPASLRERQRTDDTAERPAARSRAFRVGRRSSTTEFRSSNTFLRRDSKIPIHS